MASSLPKLASSSPKLEDELRTVERLIETIKPDTGFVEDLICLELHRRALSAALAIERGDMSNAAAD
jgi:hypothetical protein